MSNYSFRGKSISGFSAAVLLKAIQRVNEEAPNPTPEDIKALEEIVAAFEVEYVESLRQAHEDPSYLEEQREWLGDE